MHSKMSSSAGHFLLLLLLVGATSRAAATTFTITNRCAYTVWPAAIPVGGGARLDPGQTWYLNVPGGTSAARIWPRTGCDFRNGRGSCRTGDCGGAMYCGLSGQPPTTLAEFTLTGDMDYYDISVIDGFNVPMNFSCSSGNALRCSDGGCGDAYHQPNDVKTHACGGGNRNFRITFCP
ncbi:thaumatin-like pathogenesis-related protein 4 [Brachypodium distachyon]|uniref:Thaumatin-like protein n=1 Tax=Brachypodium distachyon TaxID=15368 RepID=A0A2K2CLH7_BRADI|nr:thaumatin-like pathogenesis-related protein 4 [Brachypodium distachyon]PNT62882.1 hypothetical protein BRADI_4g09220v3 [Brachypodium distachyon]|eukprot:XP_003577201.1 thaumatin-like pathogenesis-related protein 4 [Brachypodium distachyon]